jgi:dTDP-4-amino-4,6-dideoxygalactose transaminase
MQSPKTRYQVLEDAAQAHGAIYKGRKTAPSVMPVLSASRVQEHASGEGGILVSDDRELSISFITPWQVRTGVREKICRQ